jgi:hypothetical protein
MLVGFGIWDYFKPIQYSTQISIEPFKCPFGKANEVQVKKST